MGPGLQLELIQPNEAPSTWRNYLNEHGEGIHHINLKFANREVLVENMKQLGVPVLHSAKMRDKGYSFYDLRKEFGFIAEVGEMVVGPMADAYYQTHEKL